MPTNPASYNLNFIARNALNRYGFLSEMSQRAVNEAKAMHPDFWPHLEPGVSLMDAIAQRGPSRR